LGICSLKKDSFLLIVLEKSAESDYGKKLNEELEAMGNSEMWRTGKTVRSLRPDT